MEKILLITDSTSDIPMKFEDELGIKIINIPLTVNGVGYRERADFTADEFYEILNNNEELPTTAGIIPFEFVTEYKKAYDAGYTHVIYISINGKGSNTYNNSLMAIDLFYKDYPEAKETFTLASLDSHSYSLGYALPVMAAARMVQRGTSYAEIKAYLEDALNRMEVYCTVATLKFTKKSGRLGSTAAFVGELLGLRPIISFPNGENAVIDKVRGDKAAIGKIAEYYATRAGGSEFLMLYGEDKKPADELMALIAEKTGKKPEELFRAGASVTINAGPQIVGIAFLPKK